MKQPQLTEMCELMLKSVANMQDFQVELTRYSGVQNYGIKIAHKDESRHYWTSSDFHPDKAPVDLFFNLLEYAVQRELAM